MYKDLSKCVCLWKEIVQTGYSFHTITKTKTKTKTKIPLSYVYIYKTVYEYIRCPC